MQEELNETKKQLPALLEELLSAAQESMIQLQKVLDAARESDDLTALFSQADKNARKIIIDRFNDRKHFDHLMAAFSLQRYKRLMGRLRAIQAAFTLANDLLKAEETLSQEFLQTWRQSRQEEPQEETLPTEHKPQVQLTREERRLQGLDKPLTDIVSSVDQSRELLRDFETGLPELRRMLSTGNGWFEVFYVPKRHYKQTVVAYAKALKRSIRQKTEVPPEIVSAIHPDVARLIQAGVTKFPVNLREEVYDITYAGPYAKYRWNEGKRTYTISLGVLDDYPPFPFVPEGF